MKTSKPDLRARRRSAIVFTKGSRVQQHLAQETDINHIMAKYQRTGLITHTANVVARYADVSDAATYHEVQNATIAVQSAFMSLPANIRARFSNDPANLIEFLGNEKNREEAIRLGLVDKKSMATPSDAPKEEPVKDSDPKRAAETPVSKAEGTK